MMHGDDDLDCNGSVKATGKSSCDDLDDIEKQRNYETLPEPGVEDSAQGSSSEQQLPPQFPLTILIIDGEPITPPEHVVKKVSDSVGSVHEELPSDVSLQKGYLSRTGSSHEQCRVCQHEKDEVLIHLGCHCRGELAIAHRSCIDTWFRTKGSNKCEICQQAAVNVAPPESLPTANYWVWRIDPAVSGENTRRTCFSPLWVAFSVLLGGLLLDVLISVTLGVSALPVNIIIGVIVVLGLGTALRLALEFFHEWTLRRVVQRVETNGATLGYHPAL